MVVPANAEAGRPGAQGDGAAVRVLAAVIRRDGRWLLCRRPSHKRHGGCWEFPGGKLEGGESLLEAARRELGEELGVEVTGVGEVLYVRGDPGTRFVIEFTEVTVRGEPQPIEHDELRWADAAAAGRLELAPADAAFVAWASAPPAPPHPQREEPPMSIFTNAANASAGERAAYVPALLELLGDRDPLDVLADMPAALRHVVDRTPADRLRQREAPGKWSVTHVIQHLADNDLVWAVRLRMVLAHDRPALAGYDQDAWAERLHYDEADTEQALQEFTVLRDANVRLLRRAAVADLERVGLHAERGEESIRHMMRLYAAHDLMHLGQIGRIVG
jgi:8-oxo-dGTP pyrophosphatase MutT (NUDIX family)/uncharacterized damage-inducible protein DinB